MRAFIVLSFCLAAASALISEIPGYKYGPGASGVLVKPATTVVGAGSVVQPIGTLAAPLVTSSIIGPATTTVVSGASGIIGGSILSPSKTVVTGGQFLGSTTLGNGVANTVITPGRTTVVGGSILSPSNTVVTGGQLLGSTTLGNGVANTVITPGRTTVVGIDAVDSIPQSVEYNKQVFFFSAPEEVQNEGVITQQLSNILKKNLQVVFIKAPENVAATNAALQLAKQAIEQRTAIYVLSKENDATQIVGQLQQIQENVPTVPEVRIVKYRTQQDLVNAQAQIQAQYDNFGGPTGLINGGIIPILNYASGVGVLGTGNLLASKIVEGTIYAPTSNSYLPPPLKH